MAYARQQLLLLLCVCLALALAPPASTAVESYALQWQIPNIIWPTDTIHYIPGRLVNTTDCDPNVATCPGINGIDVTVDAAGGNVTLEAYPQRSAGVGNPSAVGDAPPPSKSPLERHKLAPGTQADQGPQKALGNATHGKHGLVSTCIECPFITQTKNYNEDGVFYFGATSSALGTTDFSASAQVNGQTVSTGPLTFTWVTNYAMFWSSGIIDAPVSSRGFPVFGQIYDPSTCIEGPSEVTCSGPDNVPVTVTATGAEVNLLSVSEPPESAKRQPPAMSPGNTPSSHTPRAVKPKHTPTSSQPVAQQTGLTDEAPGAAHQSVSSGMQSLRRPDRFAPKQSCPPDCTSFLTVYTGAGGHFAVYVSPGASNTGGITTLTATAEYAAVGQLVAETTITWNPDEPAVDFDAISLAPAGVNRVSLGSKAKLTATVTSPNETPVPGITVNFIVTLALDEVQSEAKYATAQVAASIDSKAKPPPAAAAAVATAATPAAGLPITKQATSNEGGKAVLKLANPKRDRPGSYNVIAYATNNQGGMVKSSPVLVVWEDDYGSYGDHGYGGESTHSGSYGDNDKKEHTADHGYGKDTDHRYKDTHSN